MKNPVMIGRFSLAAAALGFALLTGCHRQFVDRTKLQSTVETHRMAFNDIDRLRISTGSAGTVAPSGVEPIAESYTDPTGHKVPKTYYIIYCDIYWRLNWFRQELKKGDVPEDFTTKLANVRKELIEATAGLSHDGNYRVADEALTHLEIGWKHYQAAEDLVAAGAQCSSAPWSAGALAMQQFIESGGLGFGMKSLANAPQSPTDPNAAGALSASDPGYAAGNVERLTPKQKRAIDVAVQYAGEFHGPPEECARVEWSTAVEKINKLRDQLWMMNKGPNRDSGSIVDIRPNPGASGLSGERVVNTYIKNGTDLPGSSAPVGDPFRSPIPTTLPASGKSQHSGE